MIYNANFFSFKAFNLFYEPDYIFSNQEYSYINLKRVICQIQTNKLNCNKNSVCHKAKVSLFILANFGPKNMWQAFVTTFKRDLV